MLNYLDTALVYNPDLPFIDLSNISHSIQVSYFFIYNRISILDFNSILILEIDFFYC